MATKQKEVEKLEQQFDAYESKVKELTLDRMNEAKTLEQEPQTKLSKDQLAKCKEIHLKPKRRIACHPKDKINEKFENERKFSCEEVYFTAENKEIIGETIIIWTRPFSGMPAEEWEVPVNTPVWGPRYLAEQIKKAKYHRLRMEESTISSVDRNGSYYGSMVVDYTIQRLDAHPVSQKKSVFMGA